jgi:hypothetical protein
MKNQSGVGEETQRHREHRGFGAIEDFRFQIDLRAGDTQSSIFNHKSSIPPSVFSVFHS